LCLRRDANRFSDAGEQPNQNPSFDVTSAQAAIAAREVTVWQARILRSELSPDRLMADTLVGDGASSGEAPAPEKITVTLVVNGAERQLQLAPWTSLLDALREHLHLTGTKKGCDHGQCGACTVLVEGRRINSCLTLAVMQDGREITTIEGLARNGALHPLQQAFIDHDAFQCGYCTPGQIVSAVALMREGKAHTADEIRELMSGNLCRCGAYSNIVAAIRQAMERGGDAPP
jgi:xanthine dehydrogenase YagT iron-sulfur-binding subunit